MGSVIAAIEIKTTNAPALSKGNQLAFEAVNAPLQLICTPTADDFPYSKSIRVCSLGTLFNHLDKAVK